LVHGFFLASAEDGMQTTLSRRSDSEGRRKVSRLITPLFIALTLGMDGQTRNVKGEATMVEAAQEFLAQLTPSLRGKAVIPFNDNERYNWHYVPRSRKGVSLKALNGTQREAAHKLLKSALSEKGYKKATGVIVLEEVLREMEGPRRDPELYFLTIFGEPSPAQPWGWRFEGHHLSLNFSSVTKELTASTPAFLGANPAHVQRGPHQGLRVLANEEDLARELVLSFDERQRKKAVISARAPSDIITGTDRRVDIGRPQGVTAEEMTDEQRALLMRLVEEYIDNMRQNVADAELARIGAAGIENVHFAWAGSVEKGQGHYYRIHGPTFLVEYDNTQNNASHIHTVWRDPENDFGEDLLRKHYREAEHHRKP
jgi:hypothetical protein